MYDHKIEQLFKRIEGLEALQQVNSVVVKLKKTHPLATIPKYATPGSAGMDLSACFDRDYVFVRPGETKVIPTKISIQLPPGFEAQVRSRSGLSIKGIVVANSPGTIDSDFSGEICVILYNRTEKDFIVSHGDRIAQMAIARVVTASFVEGEFDETERGTGGFGSTGK